MFFLTILLTSHEFYMLEGKCILPAFFTHIAEIAYFKVSKPLKQAKRLTCGKSNNFLIPITISVFFLFSLKIIHFFHFRTDL